MAGRSLTATLDGIQQINRALTEEGWSREDLAKECDCSRQPAVKFCAGQAVSKKLFVSFCKTLGLDWEDIAGQKSAPVLAETIEPETDIDALVQTVRAQVQGDIQARCGTMRVLDMEQPIGLGDIYTSVNILEKLSGRRRLGLDELLQDCDLEDFDRFLLGQVRHQRVPGLKAVEYYDKLMILGKPGAGKTTFMKRLAILCNQGEFQLQRVPVFVTLKDYAEAPGKPTLQIYIQNQWHTCSIAIPKPMLAEQSRSQNLPTTNNDSLDALSTILDTGKALVLLDGLDEVYEADHNRVLQDIKTFTHQFRTCQCVITCRIAAREYTFEQFTEVEIADFDSEQIDEFATKWFATKQDPKKAETFIQRLKDNQPIQELATNPLLLTLLCLVFGEAADFPANRAELYKEGLDVLLKKWDGKRNIERDQVYKKLSLKRKEDLLSQLAFETFERSDYFFKQGPVEQHIIRYIRNLPGASEEEEALQLDSEAVLKSIEAQHGLLVGRARGIYSFSHLTFQEYFAAQYIISPTAALNQTLRNLATHITEKRYREIFLLTAGMLPQADTLLLLMKRQVDQIMIDEPTEEPKLQGILAWSQKKSASVNTLYKPAAIRAFYFALTLTRVLGHALHYALDRARDLDLDFDIDLARALDRTLDRDLDLDCDRALDLDLTRALDRDRAQAHAHAHERALDLALALALALALGTRVLDRALALALVLGRAKQSAITCDPGLKLRIQALRAELPLRSDHESFNQWWLADGRVWVKRLQTVMIEYRNIGHDWQLTETQGEQAQKYYAASKFLVDCLNSDCYVTKATRQYIEDTLLLPLSEIEKYPVPDAIANL